MYKPTDLELEKLGFRPHVSSENFLVKNCGSSGKILYDKKLNIFSTTPIYLYPRNFEDLETTCDIASRII